MGESSIGKGTVRAAIFLMALGKRPAAAVLRYMSPREIQKLGTAMATLSKVSLHELDMIVADFSVQVSSQTALGVEAEGYVREVIVSALVEQKADDLMGAILSGAPSKGLETLKWMDARAIAEIIAVEHPQFIAVILSHLESDHAAQVLTLLPEPLRPDVMMRVANLDGVRPAALGELDNILEKQFADDGHVRALLAGGAKAAASILNGMNAVQGAQIIDMVKERDVGLGQRIEDSMFLFDNLANMDDRGVQVLLREVSPDSLVIALKGAEDIVRDKIYKNMSKRAAEMLREDIRVKGPVRLSEVETAQKEIVTIARRMGESGEIILGGRGREGYI